MLDQRIPQVFTLIRKCKILCKNAEDFGDRDRIQTCNRLIRSQLLYSVELRDHCFVLTGAKIRTFPELASVWRLFLRKIIR